MNTSITQQHYSSTFTLAVESMHQHCHLKSCRVTSWVMSPTSPPWACCQSMWCNVEVQETHFLNKESCKSKSHGSQMVMRVVEQPQRSVPPLAINTPSFVHVKEFSPWILLWGIGEEDSYFGGESGYSNAPLLGLVVFIVLMYLLTFRGSLSQHSFMHMLGIL